MLNKDLSQKRVASLKRYFEKESSVILAFIFGSYASQRQTLESDFDVAVYFRKDTTGFKDDIRHINEDDMRLDITKIMEKEVDLVCLNDAPASLVSNVIKTGTPLVIKDKRIYWEIYLRESLEAEDFLHFLEDFRRIKQKTASLRPEEKERLLLRFDYLEDELKELNRFEFLSWQEYLKDKDKRRLIERWTENILNATIDIAKILLASERKEMPKTYEDALRDFCFLAGLNEEEALTFSKFAYLRNILAHEYLNILYKRIRDFIQEFPPLYKKIFSFLEKYLKQR